MKDENAMKGYISRAERVVQHFVDRWERQRDFDWVPEMELMASAMTGMIMCTSDKGGEMFVSKFKRVLRGFTSMPIPLPFFSYGNALMARTRISSWLHAEVDRHNMSKYEDMMSMTMREMHDATKMEIVDELYYNAMFMYTMYNPMCAMIMALHDYPECWDRLRREISEVMPSGSFAFDRMKDLKFCTNFVNEVRRFYPMWPGMWGVAKRAFECGSYHIPKGWNMFACYYSTDRDPMEWDHPEKFNPSRFEKGNEPKGGRDFGFVPQGGGVEMPAAHRCLAEDLTQYLMKMTLVHLVRGYSWQVKEMPCMRFDTTMWVPEPMAGLHIKGFSRSHVKSL